MLSRSHNLSYRFNMLIQVNSGFYSFSKSFFFLISSFRNWTLNLFQFVFYLLYYNNLITRIKYLKSNSDQSNMLLF